VAEPIAIFDLEGTLYAGGGRIIWREIVRSKNRGRLIAGKVFAHVLFQLLIDLLYKVKLFSKSRARLLGTKETATLLSGLSQEEMDQLAQTISQKLVTQLRSDIHGILQEHKQQGYRIILLSGAFQPILDVIGRELGAQVNFGTKLEIKDGYYTGRLSGPMNSDEQKATILKEFIRENHLEIDFPRSYAYGDAISDRPMLEVVGNPVAVYPDVELRAYAQKHEWKMIG